MPRPMRRTRWAASCNCGTAGTYLLALTTSSRKRVDSTTVRSSASQSIRPSSVHVLRQVDGTEAAVFVGAEELFTAVVDHNAVGNEGMG